MKTKNFVLMFICILSLCGCKSKKTSSQPDPEPTAYSKICDKGPEVRIDTILTNVLGNVKKIDNNYIVNMPPVGTHTSGLLIPCDSLSPDLQIDGLKVKISGNILKTSLQVNLSTGDIIEVTKIEKVKL